MYSIFTCSVCSPHHQTYYTLNLLWVLNELVPINTLYDVLHSVRGSLRERIRGREWQKGNTPGKCRDFVLSGSCSMNFLLPQTECEHSQVSTSPISLISPGSHCYIIHTSLSSITVQPQSRELLLSDRVHVRQQTQILEGKFDARLLLVKHNLSSWH